jgi:hypothetical protein
MTSYFDQLSHPFKCPAAQCGQIFKQTSEAFSTRMKSRAPNRRLEAEILILRHQLNILRRSAKRRGVRWLDARSSFGFIAVALASFMP